ncbi:MAG TPA: 30S ribosomal protein S16 [Chlamydiales bacterium]|nr:30S ribosomal protein S16 [Chlamydiales bacterium]
MALIIRLRQQGKNNAQSYRLVVANERSPRDGKYIEKLGWYNPFAAEDKNLHMDKDRVWHWLDQGALISERAKALLKRFAPEVLKSFNDKKLKKFLKTKSKAKKAKAKAK